MDRCFQTCDDWIATHSTSTMTVGIDATIPKYPARFRAKVIGSLLAVTVLSALVGSGMYVMRHRRLISSDFSERGRFLVSGLADQVTIGLLSGNTDFLDRPLKAVLSQRDVAYAAVYDASGTELVRRVRQGEGRPADLTAEEIRRVGSGEVVERSAGSRRDFIVPVFSSGRDGQALAFGGQAKGKPRLLGWVRVGISAASLDRSLKTSLVDSLWLAGVVLVVGVLAAVLVGWRLSAPIRRLNEGVDALRRGNLDHRVDVTSRDELGQLADSFNRMAWNLKETLSRLETLNKNLGAEVAKRTEAIRKVSDFIKLLNGPRRLEPLVAEALGGLCELVDAPAAALYLVRGDHLELAHAHGAPGTVFGPARVRLGDRNVGKAALAEEPLSMEDIPAAAELAQAVGGRLAELIYWPIRFGDKLQGVLVMGCVDKLDEAARDVLGQAVGQLAIAVANAGAFEAVDHLAKELEERNVALIKQRDMLQRQKEKLEEANRLKSQFLANTTHELRTPLNAIIGYTGLILEEAYGPVGAEQADALHAIEESAQNLLDLINQTLDYSKLEAGQMPVVTDQVDLVALCRDVLQTSRGLTKERPYDVIYEGPSSPLVVVTDGAKVRQILLNLLSNAVKFTEQGQVRLALRARLDGSVDISVSDTGIGIDGKDQELIFEAFRQIDGSTTRAAGGTGLGLAISRGFARLLGGDLTVESELGKGARFVLSLPAKPPLAGVDPSRTSLGDLEATMGVVSGDDGDVGLVEDVADVSEVGLEAGGPQVGLMDLEPSDRRDGGPGGRQAPAESSDGAPIGMEDGIELSGLELVDMEGAALEQEASGKRHEERKSGHGMVEFDFGYEGPDHGSDPGRRG